MSNVVPFVLKTSKSGKEPLPVLSPQEVADRRADQTSKFISSTIGWIQEELQSSYVFGRSLTFRIDHTSAPWLSLEHFAKVIREIAKLFRGSGWEVNYRGERYSTLINSWMKVEVWDHDEKIERVNLTFTTKKENK